MGTMKAGKANARHTSRAYSLRLNGTALGQVIPLIYGQARSTPKLIWANDFNSSQVSTGKKSGKAGGGGVFQYSIAADFLIGHRPIRGVLTIWSNKSIWILNYCDETFVCPADGKLVLGGTPNPVTVGFPSGSPGEQYTIPPSPYQIVVANAGSFLSNYQVIYTVTGAVLDPIFSGVPTQGQYVVDSNGVYTFSAADVGKSVQISYSYNAGGVGPPIVYILGATVEEPIDVTFNDFGAPGPKTFVGTSARPLWDARFALPIDDSDISPSLPSTDPFNRLPYTFFPNLGPLQPGNGTVTIARGSPGPLVGRNITVYYAYQAPDPNTGFGTPLANNGLTFEPVLASGAPHGVPIVMASEYTNHPDQWCPFTFLSGAGGADFQLGESDTVPNLSFETIGLFQWGHVRASAAGLRFIGGASPADILQDLCTSGPVVIRAGGGF